MPEISYHHIFDIYILILNYINYTESLIAQEREKI